MMETLSDELPVTIRVFTDVAEAFAWLGIERADST